MRLPLFSYCLVQTVIFPYLTCRRIKEELFLHVAQSIH